MARRPMGVPRDAARASTPPSSSEPLSSRLLGVPVKTPSQQHRFVAAADSVAPAPPAPAAPPKVEERAAGAAAAATVGSEAVVAKAGTGRSPASACIAATACAAGPRLAGGRPGEEASASVAPTAPATPATSWSSGCELAPAQLDAAVNGNGQRQLWKLLLWWRLARAPEAAAGWPAGRSLPCECRAA